MFKKVNCNGATFYLNYALTIDEYAFFVSGFARSAQSCKSAAASLHSENIWAINPDNSYGALVARRGIDSGNFRAYVSKESVGKDVYNTFIAFPSTYNFGSKLEYQKNVCSYMAKKEDEPRVLFSVLMSKFKYPLMLEWMPDFIRYFQNAHIFKGETRYILGDEGTTEMPKMPTICINNESVPINEIVCRSFHLTEGDVEKAIKTLFAQKLIGIKGAKNPILVNTLDDYIKEYGTTIIDNLAKTVQPLMPNVPNIDSVALLKYRLYPQQVCKVNALVKLFETGEKTGFVIMGCGTGKTIQCASVAESYENRKYMRAHKGATLVDAIYNDVYRNIIICPGHLVEKWYHELTTQIPNVKVTMLTSFKQLAELKKAGRKRHAREWYIMSKDFAKLSTTQIPVPSRIRKGKLDKLVCSACGADKKEVGKAVICTCGKEGARWVKVATKRVAEGLVCPNCDSILMPYKNGLEIDDRYGIQDEPLMPADFLGPTTLNSKCPICESANWKPNAQNIIVSDGEYGKLATKHSKSRWVRIKHYTNKTHKSTKNVWMLDSCVENYLRGIGEVELGRDEEKKGPRKYAPADFIKRQLGKNFFDTLIVDEAHQYKAGGSAQAQAMTSLMCASKRRLLLSGTIVGGYSKDLYYLLYRSSPRTMKKMGYEWGDVMKFVGKYGVLATEYEHIDTSNCRWNSSSRGRQIKTAKVKPGVSPLVFLDFLLDRAVFLDLADMSAFMPKLREKVITIPIEDDIRAEYQRLVDTMKAAAKKGEGMTILSKMLQTSLSFPDKPYGLEPIRSAVDGSVIIEPKDLSYLIDDKKLLNKERKLVELVNSELAENRRCLVFCEFTGSPETIITPRIKEILERECGLEGKIMLLEASSPNAREREAYLKNRVEKEDIKVILCNPRLIETGIDAVWSSSEGKTFSFSSIIFYQMGYSLFTLFQSSRRHYRLNQRDECRTYYFASERTVQPAVIQLMAEKEQAMAALQGSGSFSAESLTSMAQSTDSRQRLMQALAENDTHSENELQKLFDVVGETTEDNTELDLTHFKKMVLWSELIGADVGDVKQVDGQTSIFDFSDFEESTVPIPIIPIEPIPEIETEASEFVTDAFVFDKLDEFVQVLDALKEGTEGPISSKDLARAKKKNQSQLMLWDLI